MTNASPPLHVQATGSGPRVVMLHGWALNSHVWDDLVEPLARSFTVVRIDLPGHGSSPWPPTFDDLGSLARVLAPYVGNRGIAGAGEAVARGGSVILGWSLGAQVALRLALDHPRGLRALVLVAATPRFLAEGEWAHGVEPAVLDEFASRLHDDHEGTVRDFLALQVRGDERALETLRLLRRRVVATGVTHPEALAAGLAVLRTTDLREEIARIPVPALVIAGEHDRLTPPEASRELAAGLRRARYVQIERAAHAPFLSHRDIFLREVEQFLARVPDS